MPREGQTTITISHDTARQLEDYGDTREEQVETLLALAGTGARTDDSVTARISIVETKLDRVLEEL